MCHTKCKDCSTLRSNSIINWHIANNCDVPKEERSEYCVTEYYTKDEEIPELPAGTIPEPSCTELQQTIGKS